MHKVELTEGVNRGGNMVQRPNITNGGNSGMSGINKIDQILS